MADTKADLSADLKKVQIQLDVAVATLRLISNHELRDHEDYEAIRDIADECLRKLND